jgi:uncharacterized protein
MRLARYAQFVVVFWFVTTAFLATSQAGPFEDGLAAYKTGDYKTALRLMHPLAEQGHTEAQFRLGSMYRFGRGVSQDYTEAARLHQMAAKQGNAEAQLNLAVMHAKGQGVQKDATEAERWLRKAAEQGYAPAQFFVGIMYTRRQYRDYSEAVRWYRMAAEQGDADSQVNLGYMYYSGLGVPQDHAEAMRWNKKAAEQGSILARQNLGAMRRTVLPSTSEANPGVRLNIISAEQGDSEAQYELGIAYYTQSEMADEAESARWHHMAAKQGNVKSQSILGSMYRTGDGVPQDYSEAERWYRMAAEQGFEHAQSMLGVFYRDGRGVQQDYAEALKWFRIGAERGDASSQFSLGDMYHSGRGVPQDYVQAHLWYNLATTHGEDTARKYRDDIANKMTRGQLAEAQRLARNWHPKEEGTPIASSDGNENATPTQTGQKAPKQEELKKHVTGSGFVVSSSGHVLTNNHVVEGCRQVRIPPETVAVKVASDAHSDLALLKVPNDSSKPASFRQGRGIRPGAAVVIAGFPLQGVLTSDLNITTGTVSALAGPGNDRRLMQVTAPVQPGNSGGPLLDLAGNIVGVVVGKLNAIKLARLTGDIPQNVNFAIQAGTARSFLDAYSVPYDTVPSTEMLSPATVADRARQFTVLVECWK